MAILYIVGTPIGNLSDITYRAVETLKSVDLVACEDTRRTLKLLSHFEIRTSLISCRAENEERASEKIIAYLKEGKNIAYVSDAGTPAISDPGSLLANRVAQAGYEVIPIPGASAFASLVSVAGGRDKSVIFEGFLSPKRGRRKSRLKELLGTEVAFVLYESPYRILKLLEDLVEIDRERYICVGREMTKIHEEYFRGSAGKIYDILAEKEVQIGEFSVFVSGNKVEDGIN
jgi:16S rRNA (cytidine1402-2'-O)-methyltransferase